MCMQDAAWHGMNAHGRNGIISDVRYPDAHPHVQIPFNAYAPPPPVNHVDRAWLVARGLSVASCSSISAKPAETHAVFACDLSPDSLKLYCAPAMRAHQTIYLPHHTHGPTFARALPRRN